ncbi:hypothetical protein DMN91_004383 [Ooceraea biroi]|uniref:CBF1-interacting co-repressor CIR N-terminal domain-containing protein n=1 Tax=Ooceraea biroi TaxID=2015173 RepID=A0A3L8DVC5_OOCBI|nr:pre-mRNA-splicing factor CWC25 homolog [Ooceraea biroi]RLU24173.1 hypothetical protein DMN91_004383 [Ooceraea biroi]
MGGGDLNLKKSWHPSTMKNMEKVWKAEQQNDQENKRIAELKREIEMEKDREDMTRYAMEQGVIGKKDEKKLDWMYKGPNQMVNREDYLLGKPVDKNFEQMQQAEKDAELNRAPKNHVEYECIPPSLRFFSGNEQVDLARKMQEDPLYAIKKKEMEAKNQLLKNPVKLKQIKELLEQHSRKDKSEKKKKKSKHKDDSDDEAKLDMLLATKLKQLKDDMSEKYLLKSMKKLKHKRRKKSKKHSRSSDSESDSSDDDTSAKKRGSKKEDRKRKASEDRNAEYERSKRHKKEYSRDHKQHRYEDDDRQKDRSRSRNRCNNERRYPAEKQSVATSNNTKTSSSKSTSDDGYKFKDRREEKWRSKPRSSFTEEEKERRRQEMMANAVWRDKEREKTLQTYRQEEKWEAQNNKSYNKDFIRKQLVAATEMGSVASRIKANINNIQRSGRAMDTNFAKR